MSKFFRVCIRAAISLAAVVFILEAGVRASGIMKTYTEKIGQGFFTYYGQSHDSWFYSHEPDDTFIMDHGEFAYEYRTNDFGLRERRLKQDSAGIRLFVFGDSFTEGMGAPYDSTFPQQIQRLLRAEGHDAVVYNLGINGGDPYYYFVALKERFRKFRPTHVIFAITASDFHDCIFRGGMERFLPDSTVRYRTAPSWYFLYRYSHLCRLISHVLIGMDETLLRPKHQEQAYSEARDGMLDVCRQADELCDETGTKFLMLTFPGPMEICRDECRSLVNDLTVADSAYRDLHLAPYFSGFSNSPDCMKIGWPVDGHFNSHGYTLLGTYIFEAIEENYPGYWEADSATTSSRNP